MNSDDRFGVRHESAQKFKTVDDLKGKKVGIDRTGGSSYYATRRMLQKLGVRPETVEFIQVAGGGAQRAAAFRSGMISAVVSTIERFERERIPLTNGEDLRTNLADFAETNPKLKDLKLTQLVDNSFIHRVQQEMKK